MDRLSINSLVDEIKDNTKGIETEQLSELCILMLYYNYKYSDSTNMLHRISYILDGDVAVSGIFSDVKLSVPFMGGTDLQIELNINTIYNVFNKYNLKSSNVGDIYETIRQFMYKKEGGEFYTPSSVADIMYSVLSHNRKVEKLYDPTCGTGNLLMSCKDKDVELYGQELNRSSHNFAKLSLLMKDNDVDNINIEHGDVLDNPKHLDIKFDSIISNPPYSIKWNPKAHNDDKRFYFYNSYAPNSKADYAFIQHVYYQLENDGVATIVLPHGVLFRGSGEGKIRKELIERFNCIDAVIGLPAGIFSFTDIPTCMLILRKGRENNDVLFVDASNEFEKSKDINILNGDHVSKIIDIINNRKVIDKFSSLVDINEIKENDYNLNIPRYVDTFEDEEIIDINEVFKEIININMQIKGVDDKIFNDCKELGLHYPRDIR